MAPPPSSLIWKNKYKAFIRVNTAELCNDALNQQFSALHIDFSTLEYTLVHFSFTLVHFSTL